MPGTFPSKAYALADIIGQLRAEPSRIWSLIVTLYGDAVVPRGGSLWLGTLLTILGAMGIGGNAVRTSMSRLAADGWIERNRVGRNSFYRLAEKGHDIFSEASARIYGPAPPAWDGAFRLAVLSPDASDATRAALDSAGYAILAPGVFASADAMPPAPDAADVIYLRANADPQSARRLARQIWPPERLEAGYRRFHNLFAPLRAALDSNTSNADENLDALVARLLLIHHWRRLVLHDPMLPAALRPDEWSGHGARELAAKLYRALLPASERWLDANALNDDGKLPTPDPILWRRFLP
jgi:phenylacetic acid degradation operon negative regulatory protein